MYKNSILRFVLLVFFLLPNVSFAGKPFRRPTKELVSEADLIIIGKVNIVHPSLLKNGDGHPQGVAEIEVLEILKGNNIGIKNNNVYAVTNYKDHIMFDENGKIIPLSTAWRYWMDVNSNPLLLFLQGDKKNDPYQIFRPLDNGSGIVEISRGKNQYLVETEKILGIKGDKK